MKCPRCESTLYRKNGRRKGKQNYLCKNCGKQFLEPALLNSLENELNLDSNRQTQLSVTDANLSKEKTIESSSESLGLTLAKELLQTVLSPEWLESAEFNQFIQNIYQKVEIKTKIATGISLLLVDAENIKLDIYAENYLATIGNYPLQVKIAFANWKTPSNGKQDIELYERGYQLFHVPGGKDSADAKMIAVGASLLRYYPSVKEIFVCSGDGILSHLCNELQNQGLTVYWVRRQAQTLHIENRNTGKFIIYSLPLGTEIPSLKGVVDKIEDLIKTEQELMSSRLNNLTVIADLFQERCHLDLNNNKHILEDKLIVSSNADELKDSGYAVTRLTSLQKIGSKEDLETLLLEILDQIETESPTTRLTVSKLGTELQKICGQSPNSIIKNLKLGSSFTKFLQSSPQFILQISGKEYEVAKSNNN